MVLIRETQSGGEHRISNPVRSLWLLLSLCSQNLGLGVRDLSGPSSISASLCDSLKVPCQSTLSFSSCRGSAWMSYSLFRWIFCNFYKFLLFRNLGKIYSQCLSIRVSWNSLLCFSWEEIINRSKRLRKDRKQIENFWVQPRCKLFNRDTDIVQTREWKSVV